MAMVYDDLGYLVPELLITTRCATCNRLFREDESDWGSLCQECGEDEDEEDEKLMAQQRNQFGPRYYAPNHAQLSSAVKPADSKHRIRVRVPRWRRIWRWICSRMWW